MRDSKSKPFVKDYKSYVGPPTLYDFMGASQFRLLCTLGLRAHHSLLDIGCGSLRAGKLFINYLDEGNYYGIEPNQWLIDEAITSQVGQDLIEIKKPHFDNNSTFDTSAFSAEFDFILAQSIFSHASSDLVRIALHSSRDSLKQNGLIAANFAIGKGDSDGSRWVYPDLVNYNQKTIKHLAEDAGLFMIQIPWYHPRLTWYLFTKQRKRLPNRAMRRYLSGAVLYEAAFLESWSFRHKIFRDTCNQLGLFLPEQIKTVIKKVLRFKKPEY